MFQHPELKHLSPAARVGLNHVPDIAVDEYIDVAGRQITMSLI